jgi:hypothetical protein
MTDSSKQELLDLIDKRNAVFDRRNELEAEVERLNAEIDAFDTEIEFSNAVRIAEEGL